GWLDNRGNRVMATYQITAPDGRRYRVTGQGSAEDALAAVKKSLAMEGSGQQPTAPTAPEQPQEAEPQEHWLRRAGRTVWENIVGDDDPTTQNLGEKIGSAIHTGIEAATFGLIGDEANAAVDAAIGRGPYDE